MRPYCRVHDEGAAAPHSASCTPAAPKHGAPRRRWTTTPSAPRSALFALAICHCWASPGSAFEPAAFDPSFCFKRHLTAGGFTGVINNFKQMTGMKFDPNTLCPLREEPIKHLQATFEHSIAGQEGALKILRAALTKNERTVAAGAVKLKPLVFHFSGPSGVGKSLTAKALAKAMMKDTQSSSHNEWCGVTTINGHFYSSHDQARVRLYTKQIEGDIAKQLRECPRSVIVIDDVQSMDWHLVDHLAKTVFDEQQAQCHFGRHVVSSASAVFVIVSDLGEKALAAGMTREEAKAVVRNAAQEHWKGNLLPKFLRDVVPFLPLSEQDMAEVAMLELKTYRNELQADHSSTGGGMVPQWGGVVSWTADVPGFIARQVMADKFMRDIQGRGVQQMVTQTVDDALEEMLTKLGAYDNLHLKIVGDKIVPTVEPIIHRGEF